MDPYARIAAFYEAEYGQLEADIAYFARHAASGPLLVLGCGTGRVSRQLGADRAVTGLDLSGPMLDIARRKAPNARFVQADMRDFSVGRFGEIIVPNAAFNFLTTRGDQARCLACCRAALPTGAPLTLDLPMPAFHLWHEPYTPERTAWEGEINGVPARRTRETTRSVARQRLDLVDRYYLDGAKVARSQLALRIMMPGEVEWMLEAAGFYVDELFGDYSGGAIDERSPRILARAVAV